MHVPQTPGRKLHLNRKFKIQKSICARECPRTIKFSRRDSASPTLWGVQERTYARTCGQGKADEDSKQRGHMRRIASHTNANARTYANPRNTHINAHAHTRTRALMRMRTRARGSYMTICTTVRRVQTPNALSQSCEEAEKAASKLQAAPNSLLLESSENHQKCKRESPSCCASKKLNEKLSAAFST